MATNGAAEKGTKMEIEELLLRLDDSSDMTQEEMEDIQDTLNEQDDALRTKITMVKDEERRAMLEAERLQVQDALTRIGERIEEKMRLKQAEADEEGGLTAVSGGRTDGQGGLSAYQGDTTGEQGGLTAAPDGQNGSSDDHDNKADDREDPDKHRENEPEQQEQPERKDNWQETKDAYRKAVSDQDIDQMKKLYVQVSEAAEKGDADAVIALGALSTYENWGNDTVRNRRLLHRAMKLGSLDACETLLWQMKKSRVVTAASCFQDYCDEMIEIGYINAAVELARLHDRRGTDYDYECYWKFARWEYARAGEYYKCYLDGRGKEMKDDTYRECLYRYVWCRRKTGEEFQEAGSIRTGLSLLLEHDGKYTQEANILMGDSLCRENQYKEAVSYYLDSRSDTGIARILREYDQIVKEEGGQAIDLVLEGMIQDTGRYTATTDQKRMILVWKGDRSSKDEKAAFKYYCQAADMGDRDANQKRNAIVQKYRDNNYIAAVNFFKSSAEDYDNYDAYKYLGDMYAEDHHGIRHDYRQALEYYMRGKYGAMKKECERLEDAMKKKMEQEKNYELAKNMLSTAAQASRDEAMKMMKQLAKEGFADAVKYLKEHESK